MNATVAFHRGFAVFAVILIPSSFVIFAWSLRRTKITCMLTHI
jgi:hypothetical protein